MMTADLILSPKGFMAAVLLAACYSPACHPWISTRFGVSTAALCISAVLVGTSLLALFVLMPLRDSFEFSTAIAILGIIVGVVSLIFSVVAYTVNIHIFNLSPPEAAEAMKSTRAGSVFFLLLMVGCAAIAEEILFRGIVQSALASTLPVWLSIIATASVFAIYHLSVFQLLPTLVLGLLLGVVYQYAGLSTAVIAHVVFNLAGAGLMMLSSRSA